MGCIMRSRRRGSADASPRRDEACRVRFFRGVVMKRAESIYPVQLRAATEEYRLGQAWVPDLRISERKRPPVPSRLAFPSVFSIAHRLETASS